jgi:hypothetical protein
MSWNASAEIFYKTTDSQVCSQIKVAFSMLWLRVKQRVPRTYNTMGRRKVQTHTYKEKNRLNIFLVLPQDALHANVEIFFKNFFPRNFSPK